MVHLPRHSQDYRDNPDLSNLVPGLEFLILPRCNLRFPDNHNIQDQDSPFFDNYKVWLVLSHLVCSQNGSVHNLIRQLEHLIFLGILLSTNLLTTNLPLTCSRLGGGGPHPLSFSLPLERLCHTSSALQ